MVKKAIIPAAGYGTRSLPITKVVPKEMFPINSRPAIDYIVEEAVKSGIKELLIIVSRSKNMIMDYYDDSLELETFLEKKNKKHLLPNLRLPEVHIQYVRQPYAKGLGDAVRLAKYFVGQDPFAVLLPDDIILSTKKTMLKELIEVYEEFQANTIALMEVEESRLKNYGVVQGEAINSRLYQIKDIIEKPQFSAPSNLAVIGRYVLKPNIFDYLDHIKPGVDGEIQLTDAIKEIIKKERFYGITCLGERYDIGSNHEYVQLMNRLSGRGEEI